MPLRVLLVVFSLTVSLSAGCSFSFGDEFDKAQPIVDEANTLNTAGAALITEAAGAYDDIYNEAQETEDPFQELANQEDALKSLEPKLESAKSKLTDASKKLAEATKLNLPDWYKQYLSTLSDLNRDGSETADILLQVVKNTYDAKIESEEDLEAKQSELFAKLDAVYKHRDGLQETKAKIEAEHKDNFKQ